MEFIIGGTAGMAATVFTNPLDVIKTRLQLQGELQNKGKHAIYYKNVPHAMYIIVKSEGVTALQKGLLSALGFQLFMNSTRLGLFNFIEDKNWNKYDNGEISAVKSIAWSACSGVLGCILGSPMYLVKTQIQSYSHDSIAVGHQHGHKNTWSAISNIYRRGGFLGFYQGVTSAIPRSGIGSAAQLTSFSIFKQWFLSNNICKEDSPIQLALLSSMFSGAILVVTMCPFDLVSTRLYNQRMSERGTGELYTGFWDCVKKIIKIEGFSALYKGVGPLYLRLAPHTILSLIFWEKLKDYHKQSTIVEQEKNKFF